MKVNPIESIEVAIGFWAKGHGRGFQSTAKVVLINGMLYAKSWLAKSDGEPLADKLKGFVRINQGKSGRNDIYFQVNACDHKEPSFN